MEQVQGSKATVVQSQGSVKRLGYLFQTTMRDYVVSTLGAAVRDNVGKLLTPNLDMRLVPL